MTINYVWKGAIFCCVELQKARIHVFLKLKHTHLEDPPAFVRDVSNVGHYGVGDLRLTVSNMTDLEAVRSLIRQSFEKACAWSL